jgi:hypothetical protein
VVGASGGAGGIAALPVKTITLQPPYGRRNERDAVQHVGGREWRAPAAGRQRDSGHGVTGHVAERTTERQTAVLALPTPQNLEGHSTVAATEAVAAAVAPPVLPAPPGGQHVELTQDKLPSMMGVDLLSRDLQAALQAQNDLAVRTSALESQLEVEQLRNTLAAAVVENQRLQSRLQSVADNRSQLLGSMPMLIDPDGQKAATASADRGGRASTGGNHRQGRGGGARTSMDLTHAGSLPEGLGGELESHDTGGSQSGVTRAHTVPLTRLPSSAAGSQNASDEMAMVLTFGAAAASRLPKKKRQPLDPRLLNKLLKGVVVEPRPRQRDQAPAQVSTQWEPTPTAVSTVPHFMDPTPKPMTRTLTDIKLVAPFS